MPKTDIEVTNVYTFYDTVKIYYITYRIADFFTVQFIFADILKMQE